MIRGLLRCKIGDGGTIVDGQITYSFVIARSRNSVIGCENRLPWNLPSDLKKFRDLTIGKPIIMGRRTFDSIGRSLPHRANIVLSRENGIHDPSVILVNDKQAAMQRAETEARRLDATEIMVIGGAQIFEMFSEEVQKVYLTEVHAIVDGDAYFDEDFSGWNEERREVHGKLGTKDDFDYTFIVYGKPPLKASKPFRSQARLVAA
jgi:dihydrofolate reductase